MVLRRPPPKQSGGWLLGPSWVYIAAAVVVFVAAVAVAVAQAVSGGDSPSPAQAAQPAPLTQPTQTVALPANEGQTQAPAQTAEPSSISQSSQSTQTPPPSQTVAPPANSVPPPAQTDAQAAAPSEPAAAPVQQSTADEAHSPLSGFIVPIAGAVITEYEGHLPNAERAYRNDGTHEGLDFYEWAAEVPINYVTEVLAAKAGLVMRADLDYVDITADDWQRFADANWAGEAILDELRGRQVWIDHGRGIVTRYAHLSAIAVGIAEGVWVEQGQVIGYPGESGQREVYAAPGTDIHLHFEIRIGNGWLGQNLTSQDARRLYLNAFGLAGD